MGNAVAHLSGTDHADFLERDRHLPFSNPCRADSGGKTLTRRCLR
jgi:hypothetical protein